MFLDLSKTFDTINHGMILNKLASYGVSKLELKWFTNYLFGRSQTVVVGNQISSSFDITCGIPQGSILGGLIFLIFFNDTQSKYLSQGLYSILMIQWCILLIPLQNELNMSWTKNLRTYNLIFNEMNLSSISKKGKWTPCYQHNKNIS